MALPLMAEVTLSGELEFGFMTDFDAGYGADYGNAYIDLTATVDDNNTVKAEFYATPDDATPIVFQFFYLSSNLGKALGLEDMGVGAKLDVGFLRPQNERYSVMAGYNVDRAYSFRGTPKNWIDAVDLTLTLMNTINVEVAFNPNVLIEQAVPNWWLGAFGTFGALSAEAYYFSNGNPDNKGVLGVAAKYAMDVASGINLAGLVDFSYDLNDVDVDGVVDEYSYGVGAALTYASLVKVTAGLNGNEEDALNRAAVTLDVTPTANAGINLGIGMNLADTPTAEDLDNVDISGFYKTGAATWRLGYLITETGSAMGDYKAPAALLDGGLYFDVDIVF
jgi:hypothetical protein